MKPLRMNRSGRIASRLTVLIVIVSFCVPLQFGATPAMANNSLADRLGIPEGYIPPDFGQTALRVFVPETSHTVSGTMLDYWRANGASAVYGNPISEVYGAPNGLYSQAFERGVFQYHPDWTMTDNPTVRLMPTGRQTLTDRASTTRADGRRTGGDRRLSAWTPGSQQESRTNEVLNAGGRFSDETGFSIAGDFGQWYDSHEGWFYLGAPISEPMRDRGITVQYFENSILIADGNSVFPAPLPTEHPERYGIDTTPVEQGDLPVFDEGLFLHNWNPYGVDASTIAGRKRIEVSISQQTLTAYQGDQIILQTLVSTGVEPNHTEIGAFHVRIKYPVKDMTGVTDGSGAVTSVGEGATEGNQYLVQDVPNVMFINYEAEALHGAYWHNNFGQRMSHGCINLPLDVAAYLYEWAPLGTAVTVYE
jgi:lipoprotein-anchoring transpeptidase ErfK/SrfK